MEGHGGKKERNENDTKEKQREVDVHMDKETGTYRERGERHSTSWWNVSTTRSFLPFFTPLPLKHIPKIWVVMKATRVA